MYLFGGLLLTKVFNVPMNEPLATQSVPTDLEAARALRTDYSGQWQIYNIIRMVASGIAVLLVGFGLLHTGTRDVRQAAQARTSRRPRAVSAG